MLHSSELSISDVDSSELRRPDVLQNGVFPRSRPGTVAR
jgi:hypothetical protein